MKNSTILLYIYTLLAPLTLCSISGYASELNKLNNTSHLTTVNIDNLMNQGLLAVNDLEHISSDSSAHWLTSELLVLPKTATTFQYKLLMKTDSGFKSTQLSTVNFPKSIMAKFPHLANFQAFKVDLPLQKIKAWLKQQLIVAAVNADNEVKHLAYVQIGSVIDALYTQRENDADEEKYLGAFVKDHSVSFKLWAPTAQQVKVLLFNDNLQPLKLAKRAMVEDTATGIWSVKGDSSLNGTYYQYEVTVYHPASKKVERLITTDPYSLSLSVNSKYSQVVDLDSAITKPINWEGHIVPTLGAVEDNIFYEAHVRDFSSDDRGLSTNKARGKYKAFSEKNSHGIKHLKTLKKAGLNNIHLLPVYDLASINEEASESIDINDSVSLVKAKVCDDASVMIICSADFKEEQSLKSLLASFDVNGEQAQQIISELRQFDNFNWGYDPFHYTVPEGSYAINPKGENRLVEFREMVQNIHGLGFRVIMDVVYNHTYQFGLKEKSVLDKVVPNYYHRLNIITGVVEQTTCFTCGNTATERMMMAKLMSDSLVVWARDYKIDGFRFDLMGHQEKNAMLAAREAVRAVDADTYFYGEGWNFGEVANNSRFEQASQLNLGGSEIGTYSDRLRDAVRGGGNNTRDSQGLGNGLLIQPNERQHHSLKEEYSLRMKQLRVGLAGNLATFPLYQKNGKPILGKDIPYGDQPTGYALDPADTINYVSKHDNQTLWDNSQYRLPFDTSTDNRVRMHLQSLSFVLFSQGIPFLHMGSEFMRSKSFLRDSYDYSDWFNRVDFSQHNNYYNVGLPAADKDQSNWPLIKEVIKGHQGRDIVDVKHIQFSANVFSEMIALRMSSPLFRLTTADDIIKKVSFLNVDDSQEGLLVMKIDDNKGKPVDDNIESLVVIFNLNTEPRTFIYPQANDYQLHSIQKNSVDLILKQSKADEQGFTVPALSSVVFVKSH